jgi:uncharacterized membrane protein YfcA
VGFLGGTLVGMTGVGAGSVIAALLLIAYPALSPQLVGSATTLAVVMKLFAVGARRRMKLREMRLGLGMAAGASPLAVLGAFVSHRLHAEVLRSILALVLGVVGAILIAQSVHRWRSAKPHVTADRDPSAIKVGVIGTVVGFIAGLTSIGTGTLFVSALAGPLRVDAHRAVAAALVAGLVTLVISAVTHLALGHVNAALALGTCIGSVPGVLLGTMLATRLPAESLRGAIGGGIVIAAAIALARLR